MRSKLPIGFQPYELIPEKDSGLDGRTEGLVSVILNLALAVGIDEAIQIVEFHQNTTIPKVAERLGGEDFHKAQIEACELALKRLRSARAALLKPFSWKRVDGEVEE